MMWTIMLGLVLAMLISKAAGVGEDEPYDCRENLQEILSYISSFSGARDGHFFDCFAGAGQAGRVFEERGWKVFRFDIKYGHDIVSKDGFFLALELMLSMAVSGLVLLGPPCSLWVHMSRAYHQRTQGHPEGDTRKLPVRMANAIVRNCCFLLALGHWRHVYFILEQPGSSEMVNYEWITRLVETLRATRIWTWMRAYGHMLPKPTYLLSNLGASPSLRQVWSRRRSFERKATGFKV